MFESRLHQVSDIEGLRTEQEGDNRLLGRHAGRPAKEPGLALSGLVDKLAGSCGSRAKRRVDYLSSRFPASLEARDCTISA